MRDLWLIAAIQQGLGITALAKSSVPSSLSVIQHPALPYLGKIKIAFLTTIRNTLKCQRHFQSLYVRG